MKLKEGMPIIVTSGIYCDDHGTIYSTDAPEGFVWVKLPQYDRAGRRVQMAVDRVAPVVEGNRI